MKSDKENPTQIESLSKCLSDRDAHVRCMAAIALGEIKASSTIPYLLHAMLTDEDDNVQIKSMIALREIGEPALPGLLPLLQDVNPRVRANAASALGWEGNIQAVEPLIILLEDDNPKVVSDAASALGAIGDKRAVPHLIARLPRGNYQADAAILDALGSLRAKDAIECIVTLLQSDNSLLRPATVALSQIGSPAAIPPLIDILQDASQEEDWRVYGYAIEGLQALGSGAAEPLIDAFDKGNQFYREATIRILAEIGDARAFVLHIQSLNDPDELVQEAAAWALGLLGNPAAIEPLRKTLETTNDENRDTILEALARLGFSPEE